jgi:ATP-binding cassette, subfamily A (ABC1), member 3
LATTLKGNFAPYVILPTIIIFLRMTYGLLTEKERKIKEGMKIMGMKDSSFYFSWVIWYFGIYFITSVMVSLVLKATVFSESSYWLLLCVHQIFCWTLIA